MLQNGPDNLHACTASGACLDTVSTSPVCTTSTEHARAPLPYRKKLAELSGGTVAIFHRAQELARRPAAVEAARGFLDMLRKTVNAWDAIKPWVNATDKSALLTEVI